MCIIKTHRLDDQNPGDRDLSHTPTYNTSKGPQGIYLPASARAVNCHGPADLDNWVPYMEACHLPKGDQYEMDPRTCSSPFFSRMLE